MMTRFAFLSLTSLFVFSCSVARAADQPNVLFIAADDMNCDLGAYGHPLVKTPNLDRLCKMGVRFDTAYCQQPLCGPSRASIMTGLRPDTLDMHTLAHELRVKNPNIITLGQLFRNHGYYSARAGKIYHYGNPSMIGTDGNDDPATWDERHNPIGIDRSQQEKITRYGAGQEKNKNLGISMAWWDPESSDDEHTDGLVASKIVELIGQKKDQPFFLAAGFFNPHCPYVAPKKYFDLYPLDQISMPDLKAARRDLEDVPAMAVQRDAKNWPYYFKDVTVEEARKCKQAYIATISFVDAQVGRLLDALEDHDLLDNTIIVFWSDHGYFLGEKGLWYKRKAFERSARMPLIIAAPGLSKGTHTAKPVELLDLYPTLADLCGLNPPANLEGKSLRPLLSDPSGNDWNKPAVTQVWHNKKAWGYSIRTERYRYTEWLEGQAGRELYDHSIDSEETTNLADNPAQAKTVAELSAQLARYVQLKPNKREHPRGVFSAVDKDGFRSIFDGETLAGWQCVDMSYWSVRDAAVTGESTADNPCTKNKFLVWQGGEISDFEVRLKFRAKGNGCNSGVQFRSVFRPDGLAIGYQADIFQGGPYLGGVCDEMHQRDGKELLSANGTKSVIDANGKRTASSIGQPVKMNPWPQWNDYHIIAKVKHMTLKINGRTASELIDEEEAHFDLAGQLGLQLRSGKPMTVQFTDIQLKTLE
ncbi:MAG: sulfatase-like hydrolase/transferase [Planctomycetaceae bacterium]|nr:sulfatase-like hydrolase/transferase [Planctomycetaceae bacterium]